VPAPDRKRPPRPSDARLRRAQQHGRDGSRARRALAATPATVVGRFGELAGLTFGRGGVLYVAEVSGSLRVDLQSRAVTRIASGLARPHGLEARAGELLIAEADAGRIVSLDLASGDLTTAVAGLGLPIDITA
jgi:hypothetical protein